MADGRPRPPRPGAAPGRRPPSPVRADGRRGPGPALGKGADSARRPAPAPRGTGPTPVVDERMRERRRVVRARRRRRALRWWAAAVLAGILAWAAFGSSAFRLDARQVEVVGAGEVVGVEQVLAAVGAYERTPLTRLDTGVVRAAVEALPGVDSAQVERLWPRGLRVTVRERPAVAAVPDPAGGYALVAADGDVLSSVAEAPAELPLLVVPVGSEHERTLEAALGVAQALPDALAAQVEQVRAETPDSVEVALRDGLVVEWGSAEDSSLKAAVLMELLDSRAVDGASAVDVSAPTLPVVTRG